MKHINAIACAAFFFALLNLGHSNPLFWHPEYLDWYSQYIMILHPLSLAVTIIAGAILSRELERVKRYR